MTANTNNNTSSRAGIIYVSVNGTQCTNKYIEVSQSGSGGGGGVSAPTFSPVSGTYSIGTSVTISASVGATIYYTEDGTTPTINSTTYRSPISLTTVGSHTIKAIACRNGECSSVSSASYTITGSEGPANPTYLPDSGQYNVGTNVYITSSTSNAIIYYTMTTDGTVPADPNNPNTPRTTYTGPIPLSRNETTYKFKAVAYYNDKYSMVVSSSYHVSSGSNKVPTPEMNPAGGTIYDTWLDILVTCPLNGATIHYKFDGEIWSHTLDTDYITLQEAGEYTLITWATFPGMENSEERTETYILVNGPNPCTSTIEVKANDGSTSINCKGGEVNFEFREI